ncbi:hypothetical protein Aglo01_64330 [Actinokineospora globicatena]|nr:hypothetical protein Aglo01_64330 [Actinokineospora globicatena]GLW88746.1 hypothetical protein Aglo02_63850 [Actinokineospora globicatena]
MSVVPATIPPVTFDAPLPGDLASLFVDGAAAGRSLAVALPPGRVVVPEGGGRPAFWLSDGPVPAGLWARLRAEHGRSGLWPLLLDSQDDDDAAYPPWGNGEVVVGELQPGERDAEAFLARSWDDYTGHSDDDPLTPAERLAVTSPYGRQWPGRAPAPVSTTDPDRTADGLAEQLLAGHQSMRLGLVAAERGADSLTVAGWTGPTNYIPDTADLSAVLRDWEDRFGARVVGVGFDTLLLSVTAPPATHAEALAVAVEHFALCPDNVWQFDGAHPLFTYAERLVGDHSWTFWWD